MVKEKTITEKKPKVPKVTLDSVKKDVEKKETPKVPSDSDVKLQPVQDEEDYLKPYEYNRETGRPYYQVPHIAYSAPAPGSRAKATKEFLLKQTKVRMMIPREFKESSSILKSVTLNGYRLDFPKNAYIDVPEEIANILRESLQQTESALAKDRIDGNAAKENALG